MPERSTDVARESLALRLVDEVLDLPVPEQQSALTAAAGGDVALLNLAARLLAATHAAESDAHFLKDRARDFAVPVVEAVDQPGRPGQDLLPRVTETIAPRYVCIRELGRGGSAVVFLADDRETGQQVAVKVIKPDSLDRHRRERFAREIAVARELRHPNIVPVLDAIETDTISCYVMPYLGGESLRERLDRDVTLPLVEVARITHGVAMGLDHAHANGVLHRDIKPHNILLDDGEARLADFGLAAVLASGAERLTSAGVIVGTPRYMSPEQARTGASLDPRSDVYSLGCVVYEALAAEPPFSGRTAVAVLAKHAAAAVPDLALVDPALPQRAVDAVTRALSKRPEDRFASAGAFAAALLHATTR